MGATETERSGGTKESARHYHHRISLHQGLPLSLSLSLSLSEVLPVHTLFGRAQRAHTDSEERAENEWGGE